MNENPADTTDTATAPVVQDRPLTPYQLFAAYALAREFGHEWSLLDCGELQGLSPAQIEAKLKATHPDVFQHAFSITAPTIAAYTGDVVHTTGSGRLEWNISKEGHIKFFVHRPVRGMPGKAVTVLSLHLPPKPYQYYSGEKVAVWGHAREWEDERHLPYNDPRVGIRALPRHLDALERAVRALYENNPNVAQAMGWIGSLRLWAERNEVLEAKERAWEMGLGSVAAVDAAMEVLKEIRLRYTHDPRS